ncbi:hypothetical protein D3C85_1709110 [compost metagenome]
MQASEGFGGYGAGGMLALATVRLDGHVAAEPEADIRLPPQLLAEAGQHAGRQLVVGVQQ